jgi:hypothetical protein
MENYLMMLVAVMFCHLHPLVPDVLFEGWIYNKLFTNRVASKLPSELVPEPLLMIVIVRIYHFVIVLLELAMVFGDGLGDSRHSCSAGIDAVMSGKQT